MERIRVRVEVLPWPNSTELLKNEVSSHQDATRPYLEPCAQDVTINELAERIKNRFMNIHRRTLHIKCLTDYWGDVLDASDEKEYTLTVGHVFKERGNIDDRTVKVVQSPPDPNELRIPQRCDSILPDSSARPRKRALGQSLPRPRSSQCDADYNGVWGSELFDSSERSNKRQKMRTRPFDEFEPDRLIRSCETSEEGLYISSQSSARRGSPVHQVDDSQRSPRNKQPNPYGTPTSLTVNSPRKLAIIKNQPFSIPDSPPSRPTSFNNESADRAVDFDLHTTKSESPELTSALDFPFDVIAATTERESGSKTSTNNGKIETPASLLQLKDQQALGAEPSEPRRHPFATVLAVSDKLANERCGQFAKPKLPFSRTPRAKTHCVADGVRAQSLGIFDPIETDVESSQEINHIRSAKRPRLDPFLSGSSPDLLPFGDKEQDPGETSSVTPLSKPKLNAALLPISDENNPNDPGSGAETQLQAELPMINRPFPEQQVSPEAVRKAPIRGVRQVVDQLLPWETQVEDRPAGGVVQYVAKQQETKTIDRGPATEEIQRESTRVETKTGNKAEEERVGEQEAAQELATKKVDLAIERAREAKLVSDQTPKNKSAEDKKAKAKLAREKKANEEEVNRKRLADQNEGAEKGLAEKLVQERKTKEAKEETVRIGEAAAKEKQVQAVMNKAWQRELAALNRASNAKPANNTGSNQLKPADGAKACGEKKARADLASPAKVNIKGADLSPEASKGAKRKATPQSLEVKPDKTPKVSEFSDARRQKSSTPSSIRSDPDRVRRSMTPAVPSSTHKLTGSSSFSVTPRLSAQPSLRSALRQTSTASKRSVSFIDEPSDLMKLESSPSTAAALKSNRARNTQCPSKATKECAESRASSASESSGSISKDASKQWKDIPEKSTPKEEMQTKRGKRMKGRVIGHPHKLSGPAIQEGIVISSVSEIAVLSASENQGDRPGNTKAGPNFKKKPTKAEVEPAARAQAFPRSATPTDNRDSDSRDVETPSRKLVPKVVVEVPIRKPRSRSRSPAQYMSGLNSESSGSESESGSVSDSGSESDSGSGSESGSGFDSDDKLDTLPPVKSMKDEAKIPDTKRASSEDIEMDDASQQLQRECRQSLNNPDPDKLSKTPDLTNIKGKRSSPAMNSRDLDQPVRQRGKLSSKPERGSSKEVSCTAPKPVLGSNGLTGNPLRPSNQRYPSLAVVMETPQIEAKPRSFGIKPAEPQPTTTSVTDDNRSSSSESESESSNDEEGDVVNSTTHNGPASKNKRVRRLNGVLKLARLSHARGSQQQ